MSIKIIIIGGGIAGLSAAHILSSYSQFKVDIYESEQDVGGQASSNYGKYCYTEYSWRIFGACYHNINRIIKQIDAYNNFYTINKPCIINNDNVMNGQLSVFNLAKILLKNNFNINMINEGLYQFKNSEYIKKLFKTNKTTFEKSFLGYEDWHQFIDIDNKLTSKNLKFSTNTGLKKLMPESRENDLPNNMYLSGYYVNSTMGGVSMESSCETGLNAGLNVINKYLLPVKEYPIKHNKEYIYSFTYGLILIDKILWNNNIKSINTFIPSSILILIYFLFLIFISVNIYKFIKNKKNSLI